MVQHGAEAGEDLLAGKDHRGPIAHCRRRGRSRGALPGRGEIELALRSIAPGGHRAGEFAIAGAVSLGVTDAAVGAEPEPQVVAVGSGSPLGSSSAAAAERTRARATAAAMNRAARIAGFRGGGCLVIV